MSALYSNNINYVILHGKNKSDKTISSWTTLGITAVFQCQHSKDWNAAVCFVCLLKQFSWKLCHHKLLENSICLHRFTDDRPKEQSSFAQTTMKYFWQQQHSLRGRATLTHAKIAPLQRLGPKPGLTGAGPERGMWALADKVECSWLRWGMEFTCQLVFRDKSLQPARMFCTLRPCLRKLAAKERSGGCDRSETDGIEINHQSPGGATGRLTPVLGCQRMTDSVGHL